MEGEQVDSSLDLSHLTDQEQSLILQVLQRDLELRHRDEGRVRILQQTETDPTRLRTQSGAWFSEECSKRHYNRMSVCDLVHATVRHRKTKSRDVPLSGLFNGDATTQLNDSSPDAEGRLKDEYGRSQGKPRTKSPLSQDDFDCHNGDTDSLSSNLTEPDPASLKTSSSTSSLQSGYTLSGSMMSLFSSGDFGMVEVRGRIQFSLVYETQKEELQVKVFRCEDIASGRKNRSDPYVKTYLLPDKSSHSKKKTSVKKKTLNPVYDQTLRYKVRIGELRSRTLNLSVWHAEPLRRNLFLGEVEVALDLWDWTHTQPLWQDLQPRINLNQDSISSRGTIMLSIKFIPNGSEGNGLPLTGELYIWLREAQGLLTNKGGAIDSFVRSYILPDASSQSGQKTRVVKHSISPTYNHTMVYDGFHTSDLREACAELMVWQREGLKRHVLGGIRLSCGTGQSYGEDVSWMDSTEQEVAVWTSMIENPNHWIDAKLTIRTNLAHRSE
ncbi:synaptotagmin-like protein 1 isoform X2 [Paralichthys olivaceus]|uniref:synaptotagmin-like protein 1 isoform X2 n=1 Tax=Paralichthys olivaceus TaxID=8255 RepID=UPI0037509B2E